MLRPTAVRVQAMDNYMLTIDFDNGETKSFDVKPYIKGSWYGHLAEPQYFKKVRTDGFTVVWPEGQDLCPDEIYRTSKA